MAAEASPESVFELIRSELLDFGVDEEAVSGTAKFDHLDIDSLDAAELMTSIKREYGVQIPRNELADLTVDDLVARIVASPRG